MEGVQNVISISCGVFHSVILTKEGNYLANFTRILSLEERIKLKDTINNEYSFIVRGKILVNRMVFSKQTLIDFFHVLGFVTDAFDEMETSLLKPEKDE